MMLQKCSNCLDRSLVDVEQAARSLKEKEAKEFIVQVAELICSCYREKKKLLIAGNGGSLCDAMHFAEELVGQFRNPRPALPAIALADPGQMSCIGNDMGYEMVFSRAVEAYGSPGDLLIVLTTSGNSQNIVRAVQQAQSMSLKTVAFLGKTGGQLKGMTDLEWIVSGFRFSDRIQEAHMAAIHVIIELVEEELFHCAENPST